MNRFVCLLSVVCLFGLVRCDEDIEVQDQSGRFAFANVNSDGSISFTLNSTSLQYTLLAALAGLVLASILLPLLGLLGLAGKDEPNVGYAYGYDSSGYTGSYTPTSNGYSSYSKRSLDLLGPVMEALTKKFRQYDEDKEN